MITDLARYVNNLAPHSSFFDLFDALGDTRNDFKVDIQETDAAYIVEADLPSVKEDEIDINLEQNVLTISVERSSERDEKQGSYHVRERHYGKMARSFRVPNVDAENVEATLKDGVLTVNLKKTTCCQTKKIKILSG